MSKLTKVILFLLALLLLLVLTIHFRRTDIEQDLTIKVKQALNRPEFSNVSVSFEGRDGLLTGTILSKELAKEAMDLARSPWGVRVIENQLGIKGDASALESQKMSSMIQGILRKGQLVLTGQVPDKSIHDVLVNKAKEFFGVNNVIDQLSLHAGSQLPESFSKAFTTFLGIKGVENAGFLFKDDVFILTGDVQSADIKDRLGSEMTTALAPLKVQNNLSIVSKTTGAISSVTLQNFFSNNVIEFETTSARLSSQAKQILVNASDMLNKMPETKLEIHGHADYEGSDEFNLKLGEARAKSVRSFLTDKGIASTRLAIKSFGESRPIADNENPEGRQRNRRVEFKVN